VTLYKIKPLAWRDSDTTSLAETPLGNIWCCQEMDDIDEAYWAVGDDGGDPLGSNLERRTRSAAKAAAEAWYQQKMLEGLECVETDTGSQ